ncbi:hypothetical protein B296_00031744 [Ensete ventricosum]|uniref:ENT domain-containing protein n=1 Tax=Ensete ventricosum TaxID=4639 RepID=A0A426ZML0_ENSVE|nr:hypothetical protein B296_00031744 [Ensete ventricosum]
MKFKEGDRVEVLRRKEEQYDSWFPAKISFAHSSTYTVRYELFMTSDMKSVVETVHEEDVRPCPSPVSGKKWWTAGDIVEVLDLYSWRVGKVVKVLKIDRVVIKLFGSIQLKEHSVSDLRVPQAWQNNRWIMIDQVEDILYFFSTLISPSSNNARKFDYATSQGIGEQASIGRTSKQKHVVCSSIKTMKPKLRSYCGFLPVDLVKGMDRKGKLIQNRSHKLARGALPRRMNTISFSKDLDSQNFLHKSGKERVGGSPWINADKWHANNHVLVPSSTPLPVSEDNNDCSVASCSGNDYPGVDECQSKTGDELAANVHELELHAYHSTVEAFHASGPLSWEQESLLTNLRLSLNISNEEHLHHLRHLLSA